MLAARDGARRRRTSSPTWEVAMRIMRRSAVSALVAAGILVVPLTASAGGDRPSKVDRATATFDYTRNLEPVGFSSRTVPLNATSVRTSV